MIWPDYGRVWNYNKGGSHEHLLRGCKEALLSVDGKPIKRCLLRMVTDCDSADSATLT